MKLMRFGFIALCILAVIHTSFAQSDESYRRMLTGRVRSERLRPASHLKAYVQDGKIRLSLRDAILLTLENNSNIQIQETQIETQKFSLLGAYQLFDPALQSSLDINRYSYPGYSQLQGIGQSSNAVLHTLSQTGSIKYTQTFVTGTNVAVGLSSSKSSTNS